MFVKKTDVDAKSLAKVVVRLLTFYTVWQAIINVALMTAAILCSKVETDLSYPLIAVVAVLLPILLAVARWKLSDPIAHLITSSPSTESSEPLQTPAVHAIAISTAGLVMFLWTVPRLLSYAIHNLSLGEHSANLTIDPSVCMVPALQCLLGLSMAFGAGLWGSLIRRFKTFGLQNK